MTTVKDYMVVEANRPDQLRRSVKAWLKEGWILQGGVSIAYTGNGECTAIKDYWFCQAMVKT